jgi:NTP pyrophosphatase (non-canonical NTP hydrolase)
MTINEYQKLAMTTCMPSCFNYAYMMDNLMAEVGEFAGKVSKAKRKELIRFDHEGNIVFCHGVTAEQRDEMLAELKKEAGDIIWQASGLCEVFGWELNDVAQGNLDKLASRKQRGVIVGDGDNR